MTGEAGTRPMTASPAISCHLCGNPIPNPDLAYRWLTGWSKKRDQGGPNAIRVPEWADLYAHVACVDMKANGMDVRQEALSL